MHPCEGHLIRQSLIQNSINSLLLEVVFGHAVAERVPGHFEEATGFRDIPGRFPQRFFKHLLFHLLKRQPKGQQRRLGTLTRAIGRGSGLYGCR